MPPQTLFENACQAFAATLDARSYRLDTWEDVLGCRVWLGGPWCRREKYVALASVFWEMTYFGFEYDVVCSRIAQEQKACRAGSSAARGPKGYVPSEVDKKNRLFDLDEPDRFEVDFHKRMEKRIAVMNAAANCEFFGLRLDFTQRLEGRRQLCL